MQVDEGIRDMAARYFLILYAPMLFRTANIIFGTVLRSVGDTKTPMRVGVVMNIINTVLNFLLIYPSEMTVRRTMMFCADTMRIFYPLLLARA